MRLVTKPLSNMNSSLLCAEAVSLSVLWVKEAKHCALGTPIAGMDPDKVVEYKYRLFCTSLYAVENVDELTHGDC